MQCWVEVGVGHCAPHASGLLKDYGCDLYSDRSLGSEWKGFVVLLQPCGRPCQLDFFPWVVKLFALGPPFVFKKVATARWA